MLYGVYRLIHMQSVFVLCSSNNKTLGDSNKLQNAGYGSLYLGGLSYGSTVNIGTEEQNEPLDLRIDKKRKLMPIPIDPCPIDADDYVNAILPELIVTPISPIDSAAKHTQATSIGSETATVSKCFNGPDFAAVNSIVQHGKNEPNKSKAIEVRHSASYSYFEFKKTFYKLNSDQFCQSTPKNSIGFSHNRTQIPMPQKRTFCPGATSNIYQQSEIDVLAEQTEERCDRNTCDLEANARYIGSTNSMQCNNNNHGIEVEMCLPRMHTYKEYRESQNVLARRMDSFGFCSDKRNEQKKRRMLSHDSDALNKNTHANAPKKRRLVIDKHVPDALHTIGSYLNSMPVIGSDRNTSLLGSECNLEIIPEEEIYADSNMHAENINIHLVDLNVFDFENYYMENKKSMVDKSISRAIKPPKYTDPSPDDSLNKRVRALLSFLSDLTYSTYAMDIHKKITTDAKTKDLGVKICEFENTAGSKVFTNVENLTFNTVNPMELREKIREIVDFCKEQINKGSTYSAKCNIFIKFIQNNLLHKQDGAERYTMKPDLWKLQMFMPELYFYISWRLKITQEAVTSVKIIEYDFVAEMSCIQILLHVYYQYRNSSIDDRKRIKTINGMVYNYRYYILSLLSLYHKKSAQYYFFSFGFNTCEINTPNTDKNINANMLYILAFATRSSAFDNLAVDLTEYKNVKNKEMLYGHFFHNKLCKTFAYKMEMFQILQCVIGFMNEMKPDESKTKQVQDILVPFQSATVLVSPIQVDGLLQIQFLTRLQMLHYFHGQIYNLFLQ